MREKVNPVPGLKANTACHTRGLESADDKRGSSPHLQTSVQGDSWGLSQAGDLVWWFLRESEGELNPYVISDSF